MKYAILFFAVFNVCSVSAQVAKMPIGGQILDVIDISTNHGRFEITHPPKRTVSGWMQHEQFKIKSYPVTHGKVLSWAIAAFSGAVDGVLEGNRFDNNRNFERKFNASKTGYFGSESWRRAYKNNDPEQGYKNLYSQTFGACDFYHHADDARKIGYIGSGVVIGISGAKSNPKWWNYALDFGIGFAMSSATKAAGMYLIRN